jgi:hypothetical protein
VSLDCDECGEELWPDGAEVSDGDMRLCPDCGTSWMVSLDQDGDPYLVRYGDDEPVRGTGGEE